MHQLLLEKSYLLSELIWVSQLFSIAVIATGRFKFLEQLVQLADYFARLAILRLLF